MKTQKSRRIRRRPVARKRYQRRRRNAFRLKNRVMGGLGLPRKYFTRLKYVDNIEIDADYLLPTTYRFSANGLYDPNITGTGHQPLYFDQLMAIYDHYVVLGSKIKVQIGYQSSGNTNPHVQACILSNDSTNTPPSMDYVTEQSQSSNTVMLDPFNSKTLTRVYSAKKVFGGNILSKDELKGSSTANPAEDWYYDINFQTLVGSTKAKIFLHVEINYLAVFTEMKDIGQS